MSNYQSFLNRPLNGKQRSALAMLFKLAYERALAHEATDDQDNETWRHEQCRRIAGVTISEATNAHYKMLKMYGEDLCGNSGKAFATALQMPEQETEFWRAKVREAVSQWTPHGITDAYAAKLAHDKFHGKTPAQLVPWELEQLLWTINNRGKAKQQRAAGAFDGSKRNMKQRHTRPAKVTPGVAPSADRVILLPWTS